VPGFTVSEEETMQQPSLSPATQAVLTALTEIGQGNVHELADKSGKARSTTDKAIKALADAGLIVTVDTGADPAEGTPTRWALSDEAAAARDAAEPSDEATLDASTDADDDGPHTGNDSAAEDSADNTDAGGFSDDTSQPGDDPVDDLDLTQSSGDDITIPVVGDPENEALALPQNPGEEERGDDDGESAGDLNDENVTALLTSGEDEPGDDDADGADDLNDEDVTTPRTSDGDESDGDESDEADGEPERVVAVMAPQRPGDRKVMAIKGVLADHSDGASIEVIVAESGISLATTTRLLAAMEQADAARRLPGQPARWIAGPTKASQVDPNPEPPRCPLCFQVIRGVTSNPVAVAAVLPLLRPDGTLHIVGPDDEIHVVALPTRLPPRSLGSAVSTVVRSDLSVNADGSQPFARGELEKLTVAVLADNPGRPMTPQEIATVIGGKLGRTVSPGAVRNNCTKAAAEGRIQMLSEAPMIFVSPVPADRSEAGGGTALGREDEPGSAD
jgi:DNA-binding MarR family transcriptional regulator